MEVSFSPFADGWGHDYRTLLCSSERVTLTAAVHSYFFRLQHFASDAAALFLGDGLGGGGQQFRRGVIGGAVAPFAGQADAVGNALRLRE